MEASDKNHTTNDSSTSNEEPREELKLEENSNDNYCREEKAASTDDYVQSETQIESDSYEHIDEEADESSNYDKEETIE